VVALDQHNAIFVEVKWGRAISQDLTKLIENSQRVDVGGRRRHCLVAAREGSGVDWLIDFEELDKLTKPNS
jgi:hypothetical protein